VAAVVAEDRYICIAFGTWVENGFPDAQIQDGVGAQRENG